MDMLTGSDQRLPELHVLTRSALHAVRQVQGLDYLFPGF